MSTVHSLIRSALLALPAVTALVGSGTAARIRAGDFDKDDGEIDKAAILVDLDSQERQNSLDGKGGLVIASGALTCRSVELARAEALAEAARLGLAGYTSAAIDLVIDDETDSWTPKGDGSRQGWHDMILAFTAIYPEAT